MKKSYGKRAARPRLRDKRLREREREREKKTAIQRKMCELHPVIIPFNPIVGLFIVQELPKKTSTVLINLLQRHAIEAQRATAVAVSSTFPLSTGVSYIRLLTLQIGHIPYPLPLHPS